MVVDVGLEPGLARRAGPGAVDQVVTVRPAPALRHGPGDLGRHGLVPVDVRPGGAARLRSRALGHPGGDGMGDEDQSGRLALVTEPVQRGLDRGHRRRHETGMVGVVPDPLDLDRGALGGVEQVLPVLTTGGVARGTRW